MEVYTKNTYLLVPVVEVECEIEMYLKLQVTAVMGEILGIEAQLVAVLLDTVLYVCVG